jgi:hypothetical protein
MVRKSISLVKAIKLWMGSRGGTDFALDTSSSLNQVFKSLERKVYKLDNCYQTINYALELHGLYSRDLEIV